MYSPAMLLYMTFRFVLIKTVMEMRLAHIPEQWINNFFEAERERIENNYYLTDSARIGVSEPNTKPDNTSKSAVPQINLKRKWGTTKLSEQPIVGGDWKVCVDIKKGREVIYPKHLVSKDGRIYSQISRKFLSGRNRNGYLVVQITAKRTHLIHRLVISAFIGPPNDSSFVVNHKDGNKFNNNISNLEWVSNKENCTHAIKTGLRKYVGLSIIATNKKTNEKREFSTMHSVITGLKTNHTTIVNSLSGGKTRTEWEFTHGSNESRARFMLRYSEVVDQEGEIWKQHPQFGKYMVSTHGRVKSTANSGNTYRLIAGTVANGYRTVTVSKKRIPVHRLVIITFTPNPHNLPYINHINEDRLCNYVTNLEWCTQKENVLFSCGKEVHQFNMSGEYIKTFQSLSEAVGCGFRKAGISDVCYGNEHSHHGFLWNFSKELPASALSHKANTKTFRKGMAIANIGENDEIISTYHSPKEAAHAECVSTTSIRAVCRGEQKYVKGKRFRYLNKDEAGPYLNNQ